MFLRSIILSVTILALGACATPRPDGKLDPAYTNIPVEIKNVEVITENPLIVTVPRSEMQTAGGGLAAALIVTAINVTSNAVSYEKRRDKTQQIWDSIDTQIYNVPGQTYAQTFKQAPWLDVLETVHYQNVKKEELRNAGEELRASLEGKAMGVYASQYIISEAFDSLTQKLYFRINSVEGGKAQKEIYRFVLSDTYYPENANLDDLENYRLWIDNDNAHIKVGIKKTTDALNKQLQEILKDPYIHEEEKVVTSQPKT